MTYRLYIRYKHKLRIDVITYVPTLANDPSSAAVCLLPLLSYRRVCNIRTSEDVLLHRTGTVYFALMVNPSRDAWDPPLDLWDGIPPGQGSAVVEGHCCCAGSPAKISSQSPRPIPVGSQQESADDGCGPAGEIKIFKNVVLAHYLDY